MRKNIILLLIITIFSIFLFSNCDEIQANKIAMLTQANAGLTEDLAAANAKLAQIDAIQDSMFHYADSTITAQSLQIVGLNGQVNTLNSEIFRLNNDLDGLLAQINNDIIENIDSIYVRIKRNYNKLIVQ